jgi:hypothetical protein
LMMMMMMIMMIMLMVMKMVMMRVMMRWRREWSPPRVAICSIDWLSRLSGYSRAATAAAGPSRHWDTVLETRSITPSREWPPTCHCWTPRPEAETGVTSC